MEKKPKIEVHKSLAQGTFKSKMLNSFPSPYNETPDLLANTIDKAIRKLNKLKSRKKTEMHF